MRLLIEDDNLRVRISPLAGGKRRLIIDYPATYTYADKVSEAVYRLLGLLPGNTEIASIVSVQTVNAE